MFATAENEVTPVFVSPYPDDRALGGRRPVPIMGRFGTSICISSGSHCSQNSPENPKISGHHSHPDRITTSIPTVASTSSPVEHTSLDLSPWRPTVPVCAQPQTPSIPPQSQAIGSSRVELIRDVLKRHHFPETVVDIAADPLWDSSSNVYNSHWKAFALWANNKGILLSDLSFITLPEYLVYLFSQNKKVNTILVHKASISSVLKLLNPPTALQESTLHNVIRRMTILRPREQEVLPRWHLSVVLKGLMKPRFAINGTDRQISLELLSYKTAFLVALASGARGPFRTGRSFQSIAQLRIHHLGFWGQTGLHTYGPQIYPQKSATRDHSRTYQVSRNCSFISQWTWTTPLPPSGLWVDTLSSQMTVHKMIPMKNYLCILTLLLNCLQRTFVDGLLKLFAWHMIIRIWSP